MERIEADVVIVGGGLSGLTAARRLAKSQRDVAVLEARSRLGGRLESHTFSDGLTVDLGAQWLGPGQTRILALTEELTLATYPTHTRGRTSFEFLGHSGHYGGALPLSKLPAFAGAGWAEARLMSFARKVDRDAPWGRAAAVAFDSESLGDWVRQRVWPASARTLVRFMFESLFCCDIDQVSLLFALFSIAKCGSLEHMLKVRDGAQDRQFSHGTQEMIQTLAAALQGRIHLGAAVERIVHCKKRASLSGPGFEALARHVIIAIPPPQIVRIAFRPGLGRERMLVLSKAQMGSVVKCVAVYSKPFWREQGLSGETWSVSGPVTGTYDTTPPFTDKGVLSALASSSSALLLQAMSPAQRRHAVLSAIADRLGTFACDPVNYVERVWNEEQWTSGGYAAHVPPGAFSDGFQPLRAAEGVLHWAGTETAISWPGYMEGAIESGERAAQEILEGSSRGPR